MNPFFPYYGSKWRSATQYPSPQGKMVVEPFAGSAGYSLRHNVPRAVLIDSYPVIVGVWDYLIRSSAKDIESIPLVPKGADIRDMAFPCDEARWLVGFYCSPGSVAPANINSTKFTNCWSDRAKAKIIKQKPLIRAWRAIEGTYDCTDSHDMGDSMWFVDPPYQKMGVFYKHSFVDYAKLGEWCLSKKEPIIVCESVGADWLPFDRSFGLQGAPRKAGHDRRSTEVWMTTMPADRPTLF